MWAWMFALDPNLRLNEPNLAAAVLSGDPVEPPTDKKLLIGATTSLGIWVSGQVGGHAFRTPVGGRVPSYKTASGTASSALKKSMLLKSRSRRRRS